MTTRDRSAPSASKTSSWSRPTVDWTAWVVIARPVRRAARAAARWTRSSRAESHGLSVPISPMIPGRTPVSPDPVGRLADELVGERVDGPAVDQGLGRVVGVAVPAGAHHDVEAGRLREPDEPRRVTPDAGQGQVDERSRRPPRGTGTAPRRSPAGRAAAPSSPSGPGRARARSRCARGAASSRGRPGRWARGRSGPGRGRSVTRRPARARRRSTAPARRRGAARPVPRRRRSAARPSRGPAARTPTRR